MLMLLDTAVWEYNLTTHIELASPTHAVFNIAVKVNDHGILSLLLLPKRTFPTTSALRTGMNLPRKKSKHAKQRRSGGRN